MQALPAPVRELLESDALAHLVTINPDGSPQVTCVWVGLEGDEIVSGHLARRQKVRNVERDPRVAVSIQTSTINEIGLQEYLVVHGRARIQEGGARRFYSVSPTYTSAPTCASRPCPTRRPGSSCGRRPSAWAASGRGCRVSRTSPAPGARPATACRGAELLARGEETRAE